MTQTINFTSLEHALAYVAEHTTAQPDALDDTYGLFPVGQQCDIEDGTVLFINADHALIVVGGTPYSVGGSVSSLPRYVPVTPAQRDMVKHAEYWLSQARASARRTAVLRTIAAALTPLGVTATVSGYYLDIDGRRVYILYHSHKNGNISVTVGPYGHRRRFPQRKDGTHNYPEIAAALLADHRAFVHEKARERRVTANISMVEALRTNHPPQWAFRPTDDPGAPVRVSRELSFTGSPEQVEHYIAVVTAALGEINQ